MTDSILSNQDLAKARDAAYATANAPHASDQDYGVWLAIGDRIEADRQKIAAKLIDRGGAVYLDNQAAIDDATAKLATANTTISGQATSLQAFGQLIKSLDTLVTTVLPLFA